MTVIVSIDAFDCSSEMPLANDPTARSRETHPLWIKKFYNGICNRQRSIEQNCRFEDAFCVGINPISGKRLLLDGHYASFSGK
jgi:hypothetical protein